MLYLWNTLPDTTNLTEKFWYAQARYIIKELLSDLQEESVFSSLPPVILCSDTEALHHSPSFEPFVPSVTRNWIQGALSISLPKDVLLRLKVVHAPPYPSSGMVILVNIEALLRFYKHVYKKMDLRTWKNVIACTLIREFLRIEIGGDSSASDPSSSLGLLSKLHRSLMNEHKSLIRFDKKLYDSTISKPPFRIGTSTVQFPRVEALLDVPTWNEEDEWKNIVHELTCSGLSVWYGRGHRLSKYVQRPHLPGRFRNVDIPELNQMNHEITRTDTLGLFVAPNSSASIHVYGSKLLLHPGIHLFMDQIESGSKQMGSLATLIMQVFWHELGHWWLYTMGCPQGSPQGLESINFAEVFCEWYGDNAIQGKNTTVHLMPLSLHSPFDVRHWRRRRFLLPYSGYLGVLGYASLVSTEEWHRACVAMILEQHRYAKAIHASTKKVSAQLEEENMNIARLMFGRLSLPDARSFLLRMAKMPMPARNLIPMPAVYFWRKES